MKVETIKVHGSYKVGTELDLPESTAKALIAHKVVKSLEVKPEVKKGKKED